MSPFSVSRFVWSSRASRIQYIIDVVMCGRLIKPCSVTAQKRTKILRNNGGRFLVVSKELCYRKAETLEDTEEAVKRVVV